MMLGLNPGLVTLKDRFCFLHAMGIQFPIDCVRVFVRVHARARFNMCTL